LKGMDFGQEKGKGEKKSSATESFRGGKKPEIFGRNMRRTLECDNRANIKEKNRIVQKRLDLKK